MIREPRLDDEQGIRDMLVEFKKESFNNTFCPMNEETIIKRVKQGLDTGIPFGYVAEVGGKIVGMIAGMVIESYTDETKKIGMELVWIVSKEFRNKGEGVKLFKALENRFIAEECDFIIFTAGSYSEHTDNSGKLESLYVRQGYSKLETQFVKRR